MADVELLPLPELPRQVEGYNSDYWEAGQIEEYAADYARACVEANLAPLQAEIERLRAEIETWKTYAAREAARVGAFVALVADIRFACGDNGKRMQPELVEFIRGLAADSARYQWLRARWGRIAETYEDDRLAFIGDEDAGEGWVTAPDSLDAAIDAAIARGTVASP